MAQQTLNNGESAQIFRTKANQNFTELYDSKAIKNHASNVMDFGVGSTSMFGHIKVVQANGLGISDGVLSLNAGSTSTPGTLQLVNNLTTNDTTKALTAAQGKVLKDSAIITYYGTTTPTNDVGKDGDIYFKIV